MTRQLFFYFSFKHLTESIINPSSSNFLYFIWLSSFLILNNDNHFPFSDLTFLFINYIVCDYVNLLKIFNYIHVVGRTIQKSYLDSNFVIYHKKVKGLEKETNIREMISGWPNIRQPKIAVKFERKNVKNKRMHLPLSSTLRRIQNRPREPSDLHETKAVRLVHDTWHLTENTRYDRKADYLVTWQP